MGSEQRAVCPENDALVDYMRKWWSDLAAENPKNYTHNTQNNIRTAFTNICKHKTPITTLKQFQQIKGIGKWFVTQLRDFFNHNCGVSQDADSSEGGGNNNSRGTKSYLPQKNSVAYALLISLYRERANGTEYMHKQELIDAAEASGLSRVPIAPERGRGKQGQLGSSAKEWYSGWSAMGKLIDKGLVYKTSCPAKYMLSDAGCKVARDCLSRSGMVDSTPSVIGREERSDSEERDAENLELVSADSPITSDLNTKKSMGDDIPAEFVERAIIRSFRDASTSYKYVEGQFGLTSLKSTVLPLTQSASMIPCSSLDCDVEKVSQSDSQASQDVLRLPPLEDLQEFEEAYEIVLILDDREQFIKSRNRIIEKICAEFKIQIEVKRLPVGDGIWIARHKQDRTEYVLDFIVERKNVDDLRSSIRDNRYRDQKLRLKRTGIKKIVYVVEGDPNTCEGADSIKTACFTTEILEGFDVQRTSSLDDTLRLYGFLTLAIGDYYKLNSSAGNCKIAGTCPAYVEFIKLCKADDKMTVSNVFATQLMQVPQVTEDVAVAVLDCYPTLLSLVRAYTDLGEDILAQQELLMKASKGVVSGVASKNIFQLVWA